MRLSSICASTPARRSRQLLTRPRSRFELATDAALDLTRFAEGAPEYPDRSTTLVLQVQSFGEGPRLRLVGPGIKGETDFAFSPSPKDFVSAMQANHGKFPLGVDLIFASGASLAAAPRSTLISEAG